MFPFPLTRRVSDGFHHPSLTRRVSGNGQRNEGKAAPLPRSRWWSNLERQSPARIPSFETDMFKRVIDFWASLWKPWPLRDTDGVPLVGDRRDLPRHERSLEVTCRPLNVLGPAPSWPAVVQDISV